MAFTPTDEQQAVLDFVKQEKQNLLIQALAGAAKTSTLELVTHKNSSIPTLALAFNKRIATEMQQRFAGNTTCVTLNALGHRAWSSYLGKKLRVKTSKVRDIVRELIEDLTGEDREAAYGNFGDTIRAIDGLKSAGYIPDPSDRARSLMNDDEAFDWLDPAPDETVWQLIREACQRSYCLAFEGEIDFSDQILLPTLVRGCTLQSAPLVMVDEAQDLSALNHVMLEKIVSGNRLIAVGDPNQAIYGFRGAHEDSMDLLREQFSMAELALTTSFRCPRAIVEHVHWKTPHMKAPEWAKQGEISRLKDWTMSSIEDNSTVICRNNAPLFAFALEALAEGRYPKIEGGQDIIQPLLKILDTLKCAPTTENSVAESLLYEYYEKNKRRYKDKKGFEDRINCVQIFFAKTSTVGEARQAIEDIAKREGTLRLMTGHKSKGLEFPTVYFLREELVSDKGQDLNLRYVICTRAQERLIYLD